MDERWAVYACTCWTGIPTGFGRLPRVWGGLDEREGREDRHGSPVDSQDSATPCFKADAATLVDDRTDGSIPHLYIPTTYSL